MSINKNTNKFKKQGDFMYCSKCGKEIVGDSAFCSCCGVSVADTNNNDQPSRGYATLGFFVPIVGFILFLCFRSRTPKRAKSAGKGALIGAIVSSALYVTVCACVFFFAVDPILLSNNFMDAETKMEKYVEVEFLEYNDSFGNSDGLEVKVKNIYDKPIHCVIHIEATDESGVELSSSFISVDYLAPGQQTYQYAFAYEAMSGTFDLSEAQYNVTKITFFRAD